MKTVIFTAFYALIFALSLSAGQAVATPLKNCEKLLQAARAFQPAELENLNSTLETDMSVTLSRSYKGESADGKLLNLARIGDDWNSTYMSEPNAPQGDPRRLAIILGGDLAHFLGVSIINDQKMLAPDAKELNFRIEKLNMLLKKKGFSQIPLRFSHADAKTVDAESFNRDFAMNFTLPYAVLSALTIHDLSYHVPAVAFTPELMQGYQSTVNAIYRFTEYLKTRSETARGKNKTLCGWTRAVLLDASSVDLDVSSGNLAVAYATAASFGDDLTVEEKVMIVGDAFEAEALRFFGRLENPTIESILLERIERLAMDVSYVDSAGNIAISEDEVENFLKREFVRFKKENPDIAWKASLGSFDVKTLISSIDGRVKELQEAIR